MKRTAIFGAGQAGQMVSNWLPADHVLVCYIDNNTEKQGGSIKGTPIVSLAEAIELELEVIWIATLNKEASQIIEAQIEEALNRFISKASCSACEYGETSIRKPEIIRALEFRDAQDLRFASVRLLADELNERQLPGAVAELGVFRGELAAEINRAFPDRRLYLFDTFEGFDDRDLRKEEKYIGGKKVYHPDFADTSLEMVRSRLPHPEQAIFIKGYFPESLEQLEGEEEYVLVSLDPDLYEPTKQGLRYFYPRMVRGGVIVIHDYNSMQFPGVRTAVKEFCNEYDVIPIPIADLHGTAMIVKQ